MDKRLESLRRRCRTDLIFLCRHVLGYTRVTEETHGPTARLFIQKKENLTTLEQSDGLDRLLMLPRGTFKSSIDVADIVQTILVDPDVRILVLTGASNLASAFVGEIARHFVISTDKPTPLNLIFPEFCIKESAVKSDSFLVPCRTKNYKEPTVMAAGIEASLSGFHFDQLRCDDVVSNRNAQSATYMERTVANINMSRKMLNPGGTVFMIGTHYSPSDAYALAIEAACEEAGVKREDIDQRLLNEPEPITVGDLKVLRKPAWIHKGGKTNLTNEDLKKPEDFTLLFSSILNHRFLAKEYRRDPQSFNTQYGNNPYTAGGSFFTPELLREATIPADQVPKEGKIFAVFDLAYKAGKSNDFTAGVIGKLHNGVMYVLDTVHAKYRPSEIARAIANTVTRWQAEVLDIEDSLGAQFLENEIRNHLVGQNIQLNWLKLDRSQNAKQGRIRSIEALLSAGKLYFSANASNLPVLWDQLLRVGLMKKDDLGDALSYLALRIPMDRITAPEPQVDRWAELKQRTLYKLIYGGDEPVIALKQNESYNPQQDWGDQICPGLF